MNHENTSKHSEELPGLREETKFCHEPSPWFEESWDEYDGDWRSAVGAYAIALSAERGGGWVPSVDSREPDNNTLRPSDAE